jgi:electron transfer flavoprotein beta subunit
MIKIIVCLKLVIDPEVPLSLFKVDREARRPIPPQGVPLVISPFDENALEAALRIKDEQGCTITVLSMGDSLPRALLLKTLAVGADEVVALEGAEFKNLNPYDTARTLAHAIQKIGNYDLVFTGRQAADWDAGLVWAGIAESLQLPSITVVRKAEVRDGKVIAERVAADGIEILEADIPALLTFSNEAGELRNVSLSALMKVKKQEISKWSASDIEMASQPLMDLRDLYLPDLGGVECHLIEGESPEQKGHHLAQELLEKGLLHGGNMR